MKFNSLNFFGLLLVSSFGLFPITLSAETLDEYLHSRLEIFSITKYDSLPIDNADDYLARVELGQRLFMDVNLSGNRNISCLTCHNPTLGLSDGKALSQTHDQKGVLRRNSSSLYNIGDRRNSFMFWDGRVQYHPDKLPGQSFFTTPEAALNGPTPKALEIVSVMKSALSAQSIFPLVNNQEMRGEKGDNEIASAATNLEAWDLIIKRITTERTSSKKYIELFQRSYPGVQKINIGHAAEAMATFMREKFQSNTSPFHRYVAGDDSAMSVPQKRGLQIFLERGCVACHSGNLLGNNSFFTSVGVPSYGAKPFVIDRGRGEVNNERFRNFFFKTPSLINVGLSGPYMHNGAFKTIRDVINHYNDIRQSLNTFDITSRKNEFPVELEVRSLPEEIDAIWTSITAGFLRHGLGLTEDQKDDLEAFLSEGLTDPKWDPRNFIH